VEVAIPKWQIQTKLKAHFFPASSVATQGKLVNEISWHHNLNKKEHEGQENK
jgi:hypothetical protein